MISAKEAERLKLACVHGIIDQWWPINALIGLSAVPSELVHLQLDSIPEISMIVCNLVLLH
jgi:hypothetical protein